jgi:hypothetical protein
MNMTVTLETETPSSEELHEEIDVARSELLRAQGELKLNRDPTFDDYHNALEALNNAYQRIEFVALEIREAQDRLKTQGGRL